MDHMPFLAENLREWRTADHQLILEHLKLRRERRGTPPSSWIFHDNISPVAFYAYLKARFGEPNGFQMVLKDPSSDNYVHWHWSLRCRDHIIELMGFNFHAEAYAFGIPQPTKAEQASLVTAIKADFANHGPAMSAVKKSLEKWTLFINPYQRLRRVVDQFSSKLRALDLKSMPLPGLPTTPEQLTVMHNQFDISQAAYTEALGLGLTLRMISPVLAESFINLLIFLLAKPEIKQDPRLYQNVLRTEIDIRVRSLHINCIGFAKPLDASAQPFKDFQTLMNQRNDFLHGNVDPLRLKYDVTHFDGTTPLPERYQDFAQLFLTNSLIHVEPDVVLRDVDTVNAFIEFVLSHLQSRPRHDVQMFMTTPNPGYREDTKRAGILFPSHMVHGVLGPSTSPQDSEAIKSNDESLGSGK
jgi:hypothetical protein